MAKSNASLLGAVVVGVALLLTGCGGGDDEDTAAASPPPGSTTTPPVTTPPSNSTVVNHDPTIAGVPMTSIVSGTQYTFTPTASDGDGDILTFRISGKPAWATFTASTGRLSGTPSSADVGSSATITISATDGEATTALASFKIAVVGTASGAATLSWEPPTENDDGSALTDLAGYKIYWGTTEGEYPNSMALTNPGLSAYVVDQLTPATWYFVTTAINSAGVESEFSNVATKVVM